MSIKTILLLTLVIGGIVCQVPTADIVNNKALGEDTPFPFDGEWFSGYLDTDVADDKIHYFFFPARDKTEVEDAPVLVWIGGVESMLCSSLAACVYEIGPFIFGDESPDISLNAASWYREAHLLFLEAPPGVGFSTTKTQKWNDTAIANSAFEAIKNFFEVKFEKYKECDIFVGGNGFGAAIALRVEDLLDKYTGGLLSLRPEGIIIGNPAVTEEELDFDKFPYKQAFYNFLSNRGLISNELDREKDEYCTYWNRYSMPDNCKKTLDNINTLVDGINLYNYQQPCPNLGKQQNLGKVPDCYDVLGATTWFGKDEVKTALHVSKDITWEACADTDKFTYVYETYPYPYFEDLIERGQRLWIYSGDLDLKFPITSTLSWITLLREEYGLADFEPWKGWSYGPTDEREHAGSIWTMDSLTYVSIHGAGHRVARDKPEEAFTMFDSFLDDSPLY